MKKLFQSDVFIGFLLAISSFAVYVSTLAPSVSWDDSGELAAAAATLGIAHPTGYPLFTILGYLFSHLPLGGRPVWKLNLLSALLCSAAVFLQYRLFLFLLSKKTLAVFNRGRNSALMAANTIPSRPAGETASANASSRWAAATGVLILAFSETFWLQALSIEVYALHLFLLSLATLLFTGSICGSAWRDDPGKKGASANRLWYAFAFVLGLSFTNHMTTGLLAPAFLYLYFSTHGFGRAAWMKIGKAVIPFLMGLSLYLYLPLRAAQKPLMNWGHPVTFEAFWRHVSAGQYQDKMFSSVDVAAGQLKAFITDLPFEFGYAPLLFALWGLAFLFRNSRRMLIFSALLFLGCLSFSLNYDAQDATFFLIAYLAMAFWMACGIHAFLEYAKGGAKPWAARAVCLALILLPLGFHYHKVDESRDYAVEDYAKNLLASLDSGAVILTDADRYFVAASSYLQWVEGIRRDVTVIDLNFLVSPWYYLQLESDHPGLIRDMRLDRRAYQGQNGAPEVNPEAIRNFIGAAYAVRPLYATFAHATEYTGGFLKAPEGLAFRYFRGTPPAIPLKEFAFRPLPKSSSEMDDIQTYYAAAYFNQGIYRISIKDTLTAVSFLRKSVVIKPDFQPPRQLLSELGAR